MNSTCWQSQRVTTGDESNQHQPIKSANISNLHCSNSRVEIFRQADSRSNQLWSQHFTHFLSSGDSQLCLFETGFMEGLTFLDLLLFVILAGAQQSEDDASLGIEADGRHHHPTWSLHHMGPWKKEAKNQNPRREREEKQFVHNLINQWTRNRPFFKGVFSGHALLFYNDVTFLKSLEREEYIFWFCMFHQTWKGTHRTAAWGPSPETCGLDPTPQSENSHRSSGHCLGSGCRQREAGLLQEKISEGANSVFDACFFPGFRQHVLFTGHAYRHGWIYSLHLTKSPKGQRAAAWLHQTGQDPKLHQSICMAGY